MKTGIKPRTVVIAGTLGLIATLLTGGPSIAAGSSDDDQRADGWVGVVEDGPEVLNDFTGAGTIPDGLQVARNTAVPDAAAGGAVARSCTNAVDVGYTVLSGTTVKGQGSWTKCDDSINKVQVDIVRSTQYGSGLWIQQNSHVNDPASFGSWVDNISWSCSGLYKQEWYVRVRAWNAAGVVVTDKRSNHIVTNCP